MREGHECEWLRLWGYVCNRWAMEDEVYSGYGWKRIDHGVYLAKLVGRVMSHDGYERSVLLRSSEDTNWIDLP